MSSSDPLRLPPSSRPGDTGDELALLRSLFAGGHGSWERKQELLARQIRDDGITYNVHSEAGSPARPWSLELLPRLIGADEWRQVQQGAAQRARLLNDIVADVYGEQVLLKEALLPSALVQGHPAYLRGLHGVRPPGGIFLHVLAFDMVRGPHGEWWVVSQRTEAPSGMGYVMQNRMIVSRLFPEAYRQLNVQHLASGFHRLLNTLHTAAEACCDAGETPRLALLTSGPFNETYFEHAYLARYLGLPLVEGSDLTVRGERLYLKTVQGLQPIHGLLRRMDDGFCDPLELRADSTLGVPGLIQAIRAGHVAMANALGTAFLESPAIHGFLPAIAERLLGVPLSLPSLPTWWCGEEAAWRHAEPTLRDQVIRSTYPVGSGFEHTQGAHWRHGLDAVVCRHLPIAELQAWHQDIEGGRGAYTLQAHMPYVKVPVWTQGELAMRGASLRVYALADGRGGWEVLPGGMTRIATREAGPVSMQWGGSSLDTWVMTDGPVDAFSMLPQAVDVDELAQRQRPVSSRTGESMFWMGRYAERVETQLRLVQCMASVMDHDQGGEAAVLDALSEVARSQGQVPANTPSLRQAPRIFERALVQALRDELALHGAHSLAFHLQALERSAHALRERLSPDHWRMLCALRSDFLASLPAGHEASLPSLQPALACLGWQLAAVTGAQLDRMVRDVGWRLLSVGRLLERLHAHAQWLMTFWQGHALRTPQGFDALLELFDSAITYRARYQRRLELPAVLALLVMDENNPRALACVLRRLRQELRKLPVGPGPLEEVLDLLPQNGVGATLEALSHPHAGEAAVQDLAKRLMDASLRIAGELERRYFVHTEAPAPTLSS